MLQKGVGCTTTVWMKGALNPPGGTSAVCVVGMARSAFPDHDEFGPARSKTMNAIIPIT